MYPRGFDDLVFSRLLFEPASDRRKTNEGSGCVEKEVDTKLSVQYIKNNLQQLKEIPAFIIQIIVIAANRGKFLK